jgi:hypothetical protein
MSSEDGAALSHNVEDPAVNEVTSEGGCLCGAVRFRVTGKPISVMHCHCFSCRRNTGSLVATFAGFRPVQLRQLGASPQLYQSSPGVRRRFCGRCGTPLSYETDRWPDEIHVYLCTLDDPEPCTPQFHVNYSERVPWFDIDDGLPRLAHLRPTGADAMPRGL